MEFFAQIPQTATLKPKAFEARVAEHELQDFRQLLVSLSITNERYIERIC